MNSSRESLFQQKVTVLLKKVEFIQSTQDNADIPRWYFSFCGHNLKGESSGAYH